MRWLAAGAWLYALGVFFSLIASVSGPAETHTPNQDIFLHLGSGIVYALLLAGGFAVFRLILPGPRPGNAVSEATAGSAQSGTETDAGHRTEHAVRTGAPSAAAVPGDQADPVEMIRAVSTEDAEACARRLQPDMSAHQRIEVALQLCDEVSAPERHKELSYIDLRENGRLKNLDAYDLEPLVEGYQVASKVDPTAKQRVFTVIDQDGQAVVDAFYRTHAAAGLAGVRRILGSHGA